MQTTIPTHEEIQEYFSKAKEIKCLNLKVVVNISYVSNFSYDSNSKAYYAAGKIICVWNQYDGYAQIVKKNCENCKNCNCK